MPFHDDYARLTPFELVFPDRKVAEDLAVDVRAEAEQRDADPSMTGAPSTCWRAVTGFLPAASREPDAPPEAFLDYGALV